MTEQNIINDWLWARRRRREIEVKPKTNFKVRRPNYLTPSVYEDRKPLPLDDVDGLCIYFKNIGDVLSNVLMELPVSREDLPHNAPKYLEELAVGAK